MYSPVCDRFVLASKGPLGSPMDSLLNMVYFQANEVFDEIIHQGTNVHLQFDISDISQPFHQRCSELAKEGRSDIVTKLLPKAVDIPWLLRLGNILDLVF